MNHDDRIWHFTVDPAEGTLHAAALGSERELFSARGSRVRGEPFRYFEQKRGAPSDPAGGRARRNSWRYAARWKPEISNRMGHELWWSLPGSLRHSLGQGTKERPLHLKIVSDLRHVTDLPWEWLRREKDDPIELMEGIRIVRSVPLRYALPPLPAPGGLRVLAVISNPKDEIQLDVGAERRAIEVALAAGAPITLEVLVDPTVEHLKSALEAHQPHVLHYVGHAGSSSDETGCLILPDQLGLTYWLDAQTLARMLPSSVRLVCASTCFTAENYDLRGLLRFAYAPPDVALPTVVASQLPMWTPSRVERFWGAFYQRLATTGDAVEATHDGRLAVSLAGGGECEWGSAAIVVRDNSGAPFSMEVGRNADEDLASLLRRRLANDLTGSFGSTQDLPESPTAKLIDSLVGPENEP